MKKISCIIPAYNEEARIKNILDIVSNTTLIDEIIVIDDKSTDATEKIISKFPNLTFIKHLKNEGKSKSIYDGIKKSSGDYLLFLDADLLGLTEKALTELIEPVLNGESDVAISLRQNAPKMWRRIGIDYISGERVLPRKMFDGEIEKIPTLPKFGLEVFLNSIIIKNNYRIKIVLWNFVISPFKYKKYGFLKGIKGDIFMIMDIFKTVGIFGPLFQIIKMKKLIKK